MKIPHNLVAVIRADFSPRNPHLWGLVSTTLRAAWEQIIIDDVCRERAGERLSQDVRRSDLSWSLVFNRVNQFSDSTITSRVVTIKP